MTISEAAELVIQAGAMGQGGDVFLLDMGEPVKIVDLAQKMIALTGLSVRNWDNPKGDIEIQFTGLRPGEKLYEELLIGECDEATAHPKIMRANEAMLPWAKLEGVLRTLLQYCDNEQHDAIRRLLQDMIDGYMPQGEIVDLMYTQLQRNNNRDGS